MPRILIIEDDEKLREELKIFLNKNGYEATTLTTFDNTINDILKINPDLILLDINLPNTDGEYICKEIRKKSNMPIIIVTSRDNELDELLSINNGADHYITKPFNIQILLAKIGALLRRANMQGETNDKIDVKDFILNTSNNTIEKDGKVIELTKNEYKILKYLVQNRGKIVSREDIMECLWESESFIDDARSNTVEKDYYIRKVFLKEIVTESIKKNKSSLIQEKISIDIHDLDIEVNTDNKWIVFILNQIIQNSIKYRKKENSVIEIYANQGKENVILYIKDNGIGIKQGEITRVFEKGFTGTNGRLSNKKSTGIGLYLCKKLCNKLGIGIELNSVQNEGTKVKLVFPKDSYIELK